MPLQLLQDRDEQQEAMLKVSARAHLRRKTETKENREKFSWDGVGVGFWLQRWEEGSSGTLGPPSLLPTREAVVKATAVRSPWFMCA